MYSASVAPVPPVFEQPRILLVQKSRLDAKRVAQLLQQAFVDSAELRTFGQIESALEWLAGNECDVVILDSCLLDASEPAQLEPLHCANLPVVILATGEQTPALSALQRFGAQDVLALHELSAESLARTVRYAQEKKHIELKLDHALAESAHRQQQLERLSKHDFLTELPNRAFFDSWAAGIVSRATRQGQSFALIYFDINQFKSINDNFGHAGGDELLRQVASRTRKKVRDADFLSRLGGNEFAILTDLIANKSDVYALVERLLGCFEAPFIVHDQEVAITTSIGVAFFPDADNFALLVKQADLAMQEAKCKKQSVCFFTSEMEALYSRALLIRTHLEHAAKNSEFHCDFQGYYSQAKDGKVYAEALARWVSPALGAVSPNEFIPVVEASPLNNHLTRSIITHCGWLAEHARVHGLKLGRININVSASQLGAASFGRQFLHWVFQAEIDPNILCLELTEREFVQNLERCAEQIKVLRQEGVQLALDDFGSGYSSITHLLALPIDILKIDRLLVADVHRNAKHQALNAGIVEMAHRLNMKVVAEGIETEEEFETLSALGCDYFQGYFFSRPKSPTSFLKDWVV